MTPAEVGLRDRVRFSGAPRPTVWTVVGRDIYGVDGSERAMFFLAAELRSGDSGAPLVDVEGRAVGVVFAVSPDVADAAYALSADEVKAVIAAPQVPGDAGRCI